MKSVLQNIIKENRLQELRDAEVIQQEIESHATGDSRRSFLKKTAMGGISLTGLMGLSIEDTVAQTTSKVPKAS